MPYWIDKLDLTYTRRFVTLHECNMCSQLSQGVYLSLEPQGTSDLCGRNDFCLFLHISLEVLFKENYVTTMMCNPGLNIFSRF